MATTTKTEPAENLATTIQRYVKDDGPAKGLVHAQMHNYLAAVALADALAEEKITTPSDVDKLLDAGSGKASEYRTMWCDAVAGRFYDDITYKPEKGHDEDGNEVTKQVPTPHKINVSVRYDKFQAEIHQAAGLLLKQKLRTKPVAFPELKPDNEAFLAYAKMVLPNVENPAAAATALRAMIENLMANREVEGARRQAVFILLLQRLNGGGGKGLWLDGLVEYCKSIGLLSTEFNPAEYHFVSDAPAYSDLITSHEAPRIPKESFKVINDIVDNGEFESQKKHCPAKTVASVATMVMASNFDYPDQNNRRVMTVEFAANRILTLADDDLQYFDVYRPTRTNKTGVRYEVKGNKKLLAAWEGLFRSVVFGAVYDMPAKHADDNQKVVQLDHRHLRALQIMRQVRDADAQDGTYNMEYETALTCRPNTKYRDVDHCISTLVKCSIIDKSEKAVVRSLLCQLLLEASRMNLIPGHGRKADRIPFSCYDFEHCTVDDPDGNEEGYTFAAISNRWDRLIAAYREVPEPTKGGKQHDEHQHDGGDRQEEREVEALPGHRTAAMLCRGNVGSAGVCNHLDLHGQCADAHGGADQAEDAPGGLDASIDKLLDDLGGSGVDSTTSPTHVSDDKPGSVPLVGGSTVSPTPSGRVVEAALTCNDTEHGPGDFLSDYLPGNWIGIEVTDPSDGSKKTLDGIGVTWLPDETLACFSKFSTGEDCMPINKWNEDPGRQTPEFLVNCLNKPGRTGRHAEDVYPTFIVFEADHISGEEQLKNIDWYYAGGHICSITDSMKASKHILVPLGEAGRRITDNKVMALVCKEVGEKFFHDASVLDPATWTINRLTRCPGGIRTKKDDDDNGPWVGAVQKQIYANPEATPPADISDIVTRVVAKVNAEKLRAAFFDNKILENEEEALGKLDSYYNKHAHSGTLTEELDLAHEVVCAGVVDPASGVNWLGGLNCLRGYRMPRAVLETYLNRVREVHPTHLPQDNDYYLQDYGRKEVA